MPDARWAGKLLCALLLVKAMLSLAQVPSPLMPLDALLKKHLPQTKVAECQEAERIPVQVRGIRLAGQNGDLLIAGTDSGGQAWQAVIGTSVAECQVWLADLDGSGHEDVVIMNHGTNSSGGYDTDLTLLMLDDQQRPSPWQATGYFDEDDRGVRQIVRTPEGVGVLVEGKEGNSAWGESFTDDLYAIRRDGVARVHGKRLGMTWPALRPASQTKHQPTHRAAANSLSTNVPASPILGRITAYLPAKEQQEQRIQLSNGHTYLYPRLIVMDADGKRTIALPDAVPETLKLVKEKRLPIRLQGIGCDHGEDCHPYILWAGSRH